MTGLLCLFVRCKDNYTICNQNTITAYKAGFYNKSGSADVKVTPAALTIKFPGSSNYIYNQAAGIPDLILSPDPTLDSLKYFIQLSSALPDDTLTIVYSTSKKTLSPECGDIYVHAVSKAYCTLHTLDSVKITNPVISNTNTENFRIYY